MARTIILTSSIALGLFVIMANGAIAQSIIPDNTLGAEGSIVQQQTVDATTFDALTGGATRGSALFHSFGQFNIDEGATARFLVTPQVQNIFARVTGSNPSSINGTIGTRIQNGDALSASNASLFLINPNGIVFGPQGKLDLAGAFVGTTASRVRFGDGQVFDAANPQAAPILTVSLPVGLQFGQQVGDIQVNGARLSSSEKSLSLLGGNVSVVKSTIANVLGPIDVGAVGPGETIGLQAIDEGWTVDYTPVQNFRDIQIQSSGLFIEGVGLSDRQIPPGNLKLQGKIIEVTGGSTLAVFYNRLNQVAGSTGKVSFAASDSVILDKATVFTQGSSGVPNPDIIISTGSLNVTDSFILTSSTGEVAGGDITVDARDRASLKGATQVFTVQNSQAGITGGNIRFTTLLFSQMDGANVQTVLQGKGSAGNITVLANDKLAVAGENKDFPSMISTTALRNGSGSTGNINLIAIAGNISIEDGAQVTAYNFGNGKTGQIRVEAQNQVNVLGSTSIGTGSLIANDGNRVDNDATPGIKLQANQLLLKDGGEISTQSSFDRNSRAIEINATDGVIIQGTSLNSFINEETNQRSFPTSMISTTKLDGIGNSGAINVNARYLKLLDGGNINSNISRRPLGKAQPPRDNTFQGKVGPININIRDFILLEGQSAQPVLQNLNKYNNSGISAEVGEYGNGEGGNITITTTDLLVKDGANITSSTGGQGNAGSTNIIAQGNVTVIGEGKERIEGSVSKIVSSSSNGLGRTGDAGRVNISADSLLVADGGGISTATSGYGDAGKVTIDVRKDVTVTGASADGFPSKISSSAVSQTSDQRAAYTKRLTDAGLFDPELIPPEVVEGNGGRVQITADNLKISDKAQISTRSNGIGIAGGIDIALRGRLIANDGSITTESQKTAGGKINVSAKTIRLFGDSDIQSNVFSGAENGGNISLTARSILAFDDSDILAFAQDGRGGNIRFNTRAFFAENYQPRLGNWDGNQLVDINASGAISGIITLPDTSYVQNSLNPLNANIIDPSQLVAKTCIQRTAKSQGSLYVLGAGGLPDRPGERRSTQYPTGTIRGLSESIADQPWRKGDPIVEPQGAYQLSNGEWLLAQECSS
jgi:filamentous hemagglutinin family protein